MPEIWFYRFPEELPRPIVRPISTEKEARAWVRDWHKIKAVPKGSRFWTEEISEFKILDDKDVGRLRQELRRAEIPHELVGEEELSILMGPLELRFDKEGQFVRMNWCDQGGPSDYHVLIRGEENSRG